jgi:radical SAM protein with 4Fe4S-binding SPASM domain
MHRINPWRKVYDSNQSKDPWKYGIPEFALYLDIEPTNYCNFNCSFCVSKQAERKRGYMSDETFNRICEQGKKYGTKGIRFLRWGEPLLHSNISNMIKKIHDYGLLSHITTNGSLLTKDLSKKLIDSGLDSIIISMQGLNKEEYKKLRGNNYNKVIEGLNNLLEARGNKSNPYITISTTITDETQEEVNAFKDKWLKRVDDVSVVYTWFKRLENKQPVLNLIERAKELPHLFRCQEVMVKLSIDWDGMISPCCLDYDQQLSVGNIYKDDLMDVWKSENVKAIRTLLSNKRQDLFTLCRTCELNYSFRGKNE